MGFLFSIGLVISGMTLPRKVLAFLDIAGSWDPSLGLVMLGAIAVYALAQRRADRLSKPIVGQSFVRPPSGRIDGRLVVGSSIFGVGWGLAGYCPGPAVVSAAAGSGQAMLFVAAMLAGCGVVRVWDGRLGKAGREL
jgi:hypothetical protein